MDNIVLHQDTAKIIRKFFPGIWQAGTSAATALRVILNPFRKSVWPARRKSLGLAASISMLAVSFALWSVTCYFLATGSNAVVGGVGQRLTDANPLATPELGSFGLRVLSPTMLELTLINSKAADPMIPTSWNFVGTNFSTNLPPASDFTVTANGQSVSISSLGFKRRPIYAPLKGIDLRIGNHLYLKLAAALPDSAAVEVKNPNGRHWTAPVEFTATNDVLRFNPAIHVNEVGYMPAGPKKAMVGYYLGTLGELDVPTAGGFKIVNAQSGAVVFSGALIQRADFGYQYSPAPYTKVYEADFSAFTTPGEYRLQVAGIGASYSFMINEGVAATFARTFALGLFHQRCGTEIGLPNTRHDHGFCHTNEVEIPTMDTNFTAVQAMLADKVSDLLHPQTKERLPNVMPRHTAPALTNVNASLYPFVRQGKIDVSKGHHDAGDYSKYTINSAGLIHHLVFAADSFAGVGALDNLGLPESGDGKSDILQEAKWEADFLAKMQDSDGGFYFLVYPKKREYENDVTPDHGDAQVVWPKTTGVTAAATAALAEIASSPRFKEQFPVEAAAYMAKAQLGWTFLMTAIARYGKDGSYQKITHYGNEFMHDDELAWAASAMFAATGNPIYLAKLKEWLPDPNSPSIQRWGWWRMFEGYGCAIRTYAFAARSHRVPDTAMDTVYLLKCDAEIRAAADDITRFSEQTAYGTSFPDTSKAVRSAGWYFSSERGFDITVAYQLNALARYKEAVFANVNYEAGCNPVNVAYITGLGWKRQREVVHQQAQNDRQVLPPSGLPLGNVQAGMPFLDQYTNELTGFSFPADNGTNGPYPYYDRWADTYNTMTEFVVMDQARSVGSLAFWMAHSAVATQSWKSAAGQITGLPAELPVDSFTTVSFTAPGIDLAGAQLVWEVKSLEPAFGSSYRFSPKYSGDTWVEVEALLPDGRRIFAKTNFTATTSLSTPPNAYQSTPVTPGAETAAVYHLDGNLTDAAGKQGALSLTGSAKLDASNLAWMSNRAGGGLHVSDLNDGASVTIPPSSMIAAATEFISVEAMIYIDAWKAYNRGNAQLLSLFQNDGAQLELREDMYVGPILRGGSFGYSEPALKAGLALKQWHHLSLRLDRTGYTFKINGNVIASKASSELSKWIANGPGVVLKVGDFDGWIDEVVVRSSTVSAAPANTPPTVNLTTSGTSFVAPANIVLNSTATDAGGSIAKVEFFLGTTKLGEDTTAPYSFTWNNVAIGAYTVTARAIDNLGLTATSTALNLNVTATTTSSTPGSIKAAFVKTDTTTKGNWRNAFGAQGFTIVGNAQGVPSYGGATASGQSEYSWTDSTSDARALQKSAGTDRLASVWYAAESFDIDLNFTDNKSHRVSVYVMDWDRSGRSQRFEVIDSANNAVLNSVEVSDFAEGKYLTWDLRGSVRLRVTRTAGNNAVVEGIFFDMTPQTVQDASLKVLGPDANGMRLQVNGTVGSTYILQVSTNLTSWNEIGSVSLDAPSVEFTDSTPVEGIRIYRLTN